MNPQVQAFIRQLRPGEQVDMLHEEALAVSIEPMRWSIDAPAPRP